MRRHPETSGARQRTHLRPATAMVAALALVAGVSVALPTAPAGAVTAPTPLWERGVGPVSESSTVAVDLDGDGSRELVVGAHDRRVWALRSDGSVAPNWPQLTTNPINSSPSVADTDGDGRMEVFIGSGIAVSPNTGAFYSFENDGRLRFRFAAADNVFASPAVHSTAALGDIGSNGVIDAAFGSLGVISTWSMTQSGAVNPGFPFYADDSVFSSPAIVDVDGNGTLDIVIGSDSSPGGPVDHRGGMVRAIDASGRVIWEYRINDIVRSSPSVGDIDGDGRPEIVFGAGDFWHGSDRVKVFALGLNGQIKPGWPRSTTGVTNGSPVLADLSGDGVLDVAIGTTESSGLVWAWNGQGQVLPGYARPSGGGVVIGSLSTADIDGDGGQDLLVPTGGGVFAYSGKTGALLFGLAQGQASFHSTPLVTDLGGDGRLDVIIAGTKPNGAGVMYRYQLGPEARLGSLGWHQFRRDERRTGSWTTPPRAVARGLGQACPPGSVPEDGFTDVPANDVHEAAIDCVAWWQVAVGTGGRYQPFGLVTREQMASFIARLIESSGGTLPSGAPDAFPDDDTSVHQDNINALAAAGVVGGRADGTFGPGGLVTRAQLATFLVRAYEYRTGFDLRGNRDWFPDDLGSIHAANIDAAATAGLTAGATGGLLYKPGSAVARNQMASFLARVLDLLVEHDFADPPT